MEACFNELSLRPLCKTTEEIKARVENYTEVIVNAIENHGFKKICYEQNLDEILIAESETIASFCYKNCRNSKVALLLSTQVKPYIGDKELDSVSEKYIDSTAYYCKNSEEIKAEGFTAAYAKNTICVGMISEPCWEKEEHPIVIRHQFAEEIKSWICVSSVLHFATETFQGWYNINAPLCLKKCSINPEDKQIKLRDDHGKDELEAHAQKLCRSPYVVGIVNSLPFHPNAKDYIHKVCPKGIINIVLTSTDRGIGLAVKTTGENLRETQRIAEHLKEKYGC